MKVEPHAIGQRKVHRQQNVEEHERQDEAASRSAKPQQRALDEQLARERASRRAEGAPHSNLLPPIERAREQKAREIRARQQQHQCHDGQQQPGCRAQERIHSRDDLHVGGRHERKLLSGNPPLRPRAGERGRHEGRGVLSLRSGDTGCEPRLDEEAVEVALVEHLDAHQLVQHGHRDEEGRRDRREATAIVGRGDTDDRVAAPSHLQRAADHLRVRRRRRAASSRG